MGFKRFAVCISVAGLACLFLFVAPVSADPAQRAPAAQGIDNETCLACHAQPDQTTQFPSGELLYVTIDRETFYASVHGRAGYACVQCHTDITGYPHPPLGAATRREYVVRSYTACARCHQDKYDATLDSVHQRALAGGNIEAAVCTDCHGVHNIAPPTEPRERVPHMCERCHSQIYNLYAQSAHGAALLGEGNADVPTCVDCHGVHSVEGPSDSPFHLFSPQICAKCHSTPVDGALWYHRCLWYVRSRYRTTGTVREIAPDQQTNKPVCIDCRRTIISPVDDREPGHGANLLKTCQRCHPDATRISRLLAGHYRHRSKRR
jgi:predicted CXXCH cytochrome family protein